MESRTPQDTPNGLPWLLLGVGTAGAAATLVATATSALAAYFARRIVTPERNRRTDVDILAVIRDGSALQVVVSATSETILEGTYALYFDGGPAHAVVGRIVSHVPGEGSVTREVLRVVGGNLHAATGGWWSGSVYAGPEEMGLDHEDVSLPLPDGPAPAWLMRATHPQPTWALMVHGRGATRSEGLRAVGAAHRLGMNCLLMSYRNDGEAPAAADGRYGLGFTEWQDVQAAIDFAVANGARDVVLFGYSMGGAICLQAAERARNRQRILAMVLDAPVIDWVDVLAHQAQLNRIPEQVGRLGQLLLTHRLGRWMTGLAAPVNLKSMDWVSRALELRTPTLILHSTDDDFVPYGPSAELARRNPEMVTFVPFGTARHTKEWNVDPDAWDGAVEAWLAPRLPTGPRLPRGQ